MSTSKLKDLQVFKHQDFKDVQVVAMNLRKYFVSTGILENLGYENADEAIKKYCVGATKHSVLDSEDMLDITLLTERDVYNLAIYAERNADAFCNWIFQEVIPEATYDEE